METTTGNDVLNAAAELATRTRDQVPGQEKTMLQFFIAKEFLTLWSQRAWPDLIPELLNVNAAPPANGGGNQFAKQQAGAEDGWLGEVLGVYQHNPQAVHRRHGHAVAFYEGDGVVWVETHRSSLWVEYLRPYPTPAGSPAAQTFPDLTQMSLANFMNALIPLRWRNILACKAAALLVGADGNLPGAAFWNGQGEAELAKEIYRMGSKAPPWRRAIRLAFPRRGGHRWS